jgi:dehydrogenase/reductase SDR family protein 1
VVALAADPKLIERSGSVLTSRSVADDYGFTDVDGRLPKGPLHDRPKGSGSSPSG